MGDGVSSALFILADPYADSDEGVEVILLDILFSEGKEYRQIWRVASCSILCVKLTFEGERLEEFDKLSFLSVGSLLTNLHIKDATPGLNRRESENENNDQQP
jgi:hypothetical protein